MAGEETQDTREIQSIFKLTLMDQTSGPLEHVNDRDEIASRTTHAIKEPD
jgi:hypothetical protein